MATVLGTALFSFAGGGSVRAAAAAPFFVKAFGAHSIPLNATTSLTFTITADQGSAITNVSFTDTLPAGLVVASPSAATGTCNGTFTATAGATSVTLSGGSLGGGGTCILSLNVMGVTTGLKLNNTTLSTTEFGSGPTAGDFVNVVEPPTMTKLFNVPSIPLNGGTIMEFILHNANTVTLTSSFTDTLPAGLVIATPNFLFNFCGGGTITADAGSGLLTASGVPVPGNSSCIITVNVIGTTSGPKVNTTSAVSSIEGGTGGTATATLTVVAPPVISKTFTPSAIPLNGATTLAFTITNPAINTAALTGVSFVDNLPVGLVIPSPTTLLVCGAGFETLVSGGVSLSGATIPAGGSCQFNVTVNGASLGFFTNTTANVSSTEGGTGNTATAGLQVGVPMTITKAFQVPAFPLGAPLGLSFVVTNPAPFTQHGVSFTDVLPAGVVVASPNGFTGSCSVGAALTLTAVPGSGTISETTDVYVPGTSCSFTVNVTTTTPGVKVNSVVVSSTESGSSTPATATLTIDSGVPVMAPWMLALVGIALAGVAALVMRRRRAIH